MEKIEKKIEKDLKKYCIENPVIAEIIQKVSRCSEKKYIAVGCLLAILDAIEHNKMLPKLLSPETHQEVINTEKNLLKVYEKEMKNLKNCEDEITDIAIKIIIDMFFEKDSEDKLLIKKNIGLILRLISIENKKTPA